MEKPKPLYQYPPCKVLQSFDLFTLKMMGEKGKLTIDKM